MTARGQALGVSVFHSILCMIIDIRQRHPKCPSTCRDVSHPDEPRHARRRSVLWNKRAASPSVRWKRAQTCQNSVVVVDPTRCPGVQAPHARRRSTKSQTLMLASRPASTSKGTLFRITLSDHAASNQAIQCVIRKLTCRWVRRGLRSARYTDR